MANNDVVSQTKFFIDAPFGNFQLTKVKSADVNDEKDAEIVMAVGISGGAGFRYKEGGGEITLEVYREQGVPEVDWRKAQRQKLRMAFTIQDTGGQRDQFQGVIVAQVTRKDDDAGSHMDTVKLKYLKFVPLPPAST